MRPPIKPVAPPNIKQPLRDIMRGVGLFAEMTEDTLEPAASLLPAPMRRTFHGVLTSLEAVGSRAVTPSLDLKTIVSASHYVNFGAGESPTSLVQALAFAWQKASLLRTDRHFLFSEVIAARALNNASIATGLARELRCAMIFKTLAQAQPIGRMPGVDTSLNSEDETQVSLFLFATLVWLLTDRAVTLEDEEQLFELAFALTMAKEDAIAHNLDDIEVLSHALQDLADHV